MGHLDPTQNSQAASEKKLKASACELEQKLEARTRELAEAREQQTATSEILRVISSSPGDLKPVFETMLENATRLSEAKFGFLFLREGDAFRAVAMHGPPPIVEWMQQAPVVELRDHPHVPLARLSKPKRRSTFPTSPLSRAISSVIPAWSPSSKPPARAACFRCRCSRSKS